MDNRKMGRLFVTLSVALLSTGCMKSYIKSVGGEPERSEKRIFLAEFDTTWQAVLDALKSYNLEISNRESGYVQTRWTDNSNEQNLVDPYGAGKSYLKTMFRYRIQAVKGTFNGKASVRVSVTKDQLVQSDVLEGWRPTTVEPIEENTLLYRVERLVYLRQEFARLEKQKADEAINAANATNAMPPSQSDSMPPESTSATP